MLKSPKGTKAQRKIKRVSLCLCYFVPLCLTLLFAQSVTEGFRAKKMKGEIVKWELEADSAQFDENSKTLKGVKVKFYPEGKDPFTIKADDGLVRENVPATDPTVNGAGKKDEIYLENNVRVIGYLNSTIKCDNLSWDSITEIMRTEDKVEVEAEKWVIRGKGIEFDPLEDIMFFKKDVTMQIIE
jgi:hypothetical protein